MCRRMLVLDAIRVMLSGSRRVAAVLAIFALLAVVGCVSTPDPGKAHDGASEPSVLLADGRMAGPRSVSRYDGLNGVQDGLVRTVGAFREQTAEVFPGAFREQTVGAFPGAFRETPLPLILSIVALFVLPGCAFLTVFFGGVRQWLSVPLIVGLSVSLLPVGMLYLTLAGIRLDAGSVRISLGVLILASILWCIGRPLRTARRLKPRQTLQSPPSRTALTSALSKGERGQTYSPTEDLIFAGGLAFVLAASAVVRLLHLRDLVVPMWVDSVQHVEIVRLIVDRGGVPDSYLPFAEVAPFSYHFGFHALVAFAHWLSGAEIPISTLFVGQALNFAVVLSTYLLGTRMMGGRLAGLVSAAVVGVFSTMPAYYTSWGRYTQLTGMVVLPVAVALSLEANEQRRTRDRLGYVALAGLVVGGLIVAHPRVTVFYLCFLMAYAVVEIAASRGERTAAIPTLATVGATGVVGMMFVAPWLWTMATSLLISVWQGASAAPAAVNPFPFDYFVSWVDRALIGMAAVGLVLAVARRSKSAITVVIWTGLMLLSGNPYLIGLPGGNIVSNGAVAISLFLPVALLVGYLATSSADLLRARWWPLPALVLVAVLFVVASLLGASRLAGVMNPSCVLFFPQDQEAMEWIVENTPADSTFLVNSRHWQFDIYVGSDGGYWIPALTGRKTTMPSVLYALGDREYVAGVNSVARTVSEVAFGEGDVWAWLRKQGVDYVYIGYRGGPLAPEAFMDKPGFEVVYARHGVWVFRVVERG